MITIHIKKPKTSQLTRTQKGCGMRITEGDHPIMVKKELANKIKNKFKNGKAHTLYSHEFEHMEGGSLKSIAKEIKKGVQIKARDTSREAKKQARELADQLKQEAIQTGREIKKTAIKEGNIFVRDVAKPYLTEMVQAGIMGLGGAAAVAQPELAPFIGVGALALSSMAGNYIEDFGKKPKIPSASTYVSPQDYNQIQQEYTPPSVSEAYVNPHEIVRTKMNDSVDDFQRANRMIGFGFGRDHKVGCGLFAGGGLVSRDGYTPPALMSPNPTWLMNRNIMPPYMQNATY